MTSLDIQELERQLKETLPSFYRNFLLAYPNKLIEASEKTLNKVPFLSYAIEDLVKYNQWFQTKNTNWFIIGEDEYGNFYLINKADLSEKVYFWDHESASGFEGEEEDYKWENYIQEETESLQAFTEQILEMYHNF